MDKSKDYYTRNREALLLKSKAYYQKRKEKDPEFYLKPRVNKTRTEYTEDPADIIQMQRNMEWITYVRELDGPETVKEKRRKNNQI